MFWSFAEKTLKQRMMWGKLSENSAFIRTPLCRGAEGKMDFG